MNQLWSRFRALPRSARWLIGAAMLFGLYFLVVEPVIDLTNQLNAKSDRLASGLKELSASQRAESTTGQELALGVLRFGAVLGPGSDDRAAALNGRVEQILRDRDVSSWSIKTRSGSTLGRDAMQGVLREGEQVERRILDLDFEAHPDTAIEVIADLERAPEVASVGRVTIRKSDRASGGVVQVTVSPEAWILTRRAAR